MFKRPWLAALVAFLAVLAVGVGVLFAADAFPAALRTANAKGKFAGQTVGVAALAVAVAVYFLAKARRDR